MYAQNIFCTCVKICMISSTSVLVKMSINA